jgi:cytochrome oxidase Cu insertion factor (SCO1/SenC/PrrC family)
MKRGWPRDIALIALITLGPLAFAFIVYFGPLEMREVPELENPDRELLAVPQPLPEIALRTPGGGQTASDWARYRWSLIYAKMTPCEGRCTESLVRLTQVYLALGRDRLRAQRVFLTADADFRMTGDRELLVGYLNDDREAELILALGRDRLEQGRFFIVDPLGNLVMSYPPEADQGRLLKDLERLLNVSRIG